MDDARNTISSSRRTLLVTRSRLYAAGTLAVIAVAVAAYLFVARHAPLRNLTLENPKPVPVFAFADAGNRMHPLSEFRGRFVLLNFWGTWCAPCIRELPSLARLSAAMPRNKFLVLAVAVQPESVKEVRDFLVAHEASNLSIYIDSPPTFFRAFQAVDIPLTVLIDPQGREIARALGPAEWDAPGAVRYMRELTNIH